MVLVWREACLAVRGKRIDLMEYKMMWIDRLYSHRLSCFSKVFSIYKAMGKKRHNQPQFARLRSHSIRLRSSSTFPLANVSESKADRAANPDGVNVKLRYLPPHNRCRMGIASTAFDGIQSR